MLKLKEIKLSGFKSIDQEGQSIPFGDVTVLIGANGSGKSNLVSFFEMLNAMNSNKLRQYIAKKGYARAFLHYGPKITNSIAAHLTFEGYGEEMEYGFSLSHTSDESFIQTSEVANNKKNISIDLSSDEDLNGTGFRLADTEETGDAESMYDILSQTRTFQFHDTTPEARIRGKCYMSDNRELSKDAGNLAAYLYAMQQNDETNRYYQRLLTRIRAVFPQFGSFELSPDKLNDKYIQLDWYEKGSDYLFGPHQLSDGTLRYMALATLLLQPPEWLPKVIVIDEPELGLHPSAITDLVGMVKNVSMHSQVILATQSPQIVDEFSPEEIVVVERERQDRTSVFRKYNEDELKEWLDRYTISELWDKNVIGGNP